MNCKRFTARNSREALTLVRQAFGEDAVVLSTQHAPDVPLKHEIKRLGLSALCWIVAVLAGEGLPLRERLGGAASLFEPLGQLDRRQPGGATGIARWHACRLKAPTRRAGLSLRNRSRGCGGAGRPSARWSALRSFSNAPSSLDGTTLGPSLRALRQSSWVSRNSPSTPTAMAARISSGAKCPAPPLFVPRPPGACTEWVPSKITGTPNPRNWSPFGFIGDSLGLANSLVEGDFAAQARQDLFEGRAEQIGVVVRGSVRDRVVEQGRVRDRQARTPVLKVTGPGFSRMVFTARYRCVA